jgi:hypothetical protein
MVVLSVLFVDRPRRAMLPIVAALVVATALIGTAGAAWAQAPRGQPSLGLQEQGPPPTPPAAVGEPQLPPPSRDNPGLLQEIGKLFDKILPLKKAGDRSGGASAPSTEGASDGGKDALKATGETLSRLAKPSAMVTGRSVCPLAANRTPDCKAGADKLCQSKGYKDGKSLNTDAAESCSPKVLIPGRARKPDDCRTDTYVTSALCQ